MTEQNTSIPRVSWAAVCARRLDRHALAIPLTDVRPVDVVAAICGAHAQIQSAAELSIGVRTSHTTRADIQQALWAEHSLIRTFGPRGTVHLLPAQEFALWIGALSAIPHSPSPFAKEVRLSPEQTETIIAAIADALHDSELTIDELNEAVIAGAGAWAGELVMPAFQALWPRWRQAVDIAAQRGVLCFGPNRGRNSTYTNPRRWISDLQPADPQTACTAIARSYLHAYGPATSAQFAQWLGAPQNWASELFASLADQFVQVELDGARAWMLGDDDVPQSEAIAGVRLLPYFDPYVVGCHPRKLLFAGQAATRALSPSGQAGNFPVVLVDGVIAGVWHLRRSGKKLAITIELFHQLTAAQRHALDDQVERIGVFLEGRPQLAFGKIAVGGHA